MQASIKISEIKKTVKDHVRVLEVQVDSKLKWRPYIVRIEKKFAK